ncbi:hypothetical protein M514_20660 [Trichuris suis]|uniref:Uncharacterized protein n=1 Tax=Trichuris suis TaxID=68888 RepID=A0A085N838_9BILA|nr:hypothetical protein M514_22229 [Trichuris suis]KFD67224.1 hypothetical protein M514_20660 [Trichuris suis]
MSLWRNRLARSAVNRKVGGSSPPRDDRQQCYHEVMSEQSETANSQYYTDRHHSSEDVYSKRCFVF